MSSRNKGTRNMRSDRATKGGLGIPSEGNMSALSIGSARPISSSGLGVPGISVPSGDSFGLGSTRKQKRKQRKLMNSMNAMNAMDAMPSFRPESQGTPQRETAKQNVRRLPRTPRTEDAAIRGLQLGLEALGESADALPMEQLLGQYRELRDNFNSVWQEHPAPGYNRMVVYRGLNGRQEFMDMVQYRQVRHIGVERATRLMEQKGYSGVEEAMLSHVAKAESRPEGANDLKVDQATTRADPSLISDVRQQKPLGEGPEMVSTALAAGGWEGDLRLKVAMIVDVPDELMDTLRSVSNSSENEITLLANTEILALKVADSEQISRLGWGAVAREKGGMSTLSVGLGF